MNLAFVWYLTKAVACLGLFTASCTSVGLTIHKHLNKSTSNKELKISNDVKWFETAQRLRKENEELKNKLKKNK